MQYKVTDGEGSHGKHGPVRRRKIAAITVTGIISSVLLASLNIVAIARAPKATWDSPSPMKEKRFSTRVTPRREEQRAVKTPTISEYLTKGYCI